MQEGEATQGDSWAVRYIDDPASGEPVPRYAFVYSQNRLFLLQVELRLDGSKLVAFYSQDDFVAFDFIGYNKTLIIKFDGWETSRKINVSNFNTGGGIYISESRSNSGYNSNVGFDRIVRSLANQNTLAIQAKLKHLGAEWIKFPLTGSRAALEEIGMISTPKQAPRQMALPDIAEAADLYTVQVRCFK